MQVAFKSTQPNKEVWRKREARQTETRRRLKWPQRHMYGCGGITNHAKRPTHVISFLSHYITPSLTTSPPHSLTTINILLRYSIFSHHNYSFTTINLKIYYIHSQIHPQPIFFPKMERLWLGTSHLEGKLLVRTKSML
jgi:hypothetical protein